MGALCLLASSLTPFDVHALHPTHYAASSRLASGHWEKVKVSQSGVQFVSNSQLSSMGFSDPSKVNVFGFGGRLIKERMDDSHPDDLPLLPSVRTASGIIFFGVNSIDWTESTGASNYVHYIHPYQEESFYFLSDIPVEEEEKDVARLLEVAGLPEADTFIERLVHEQDLFAPAITGRNLFGEDLRSGQLQLDFNLPGNVGGDAAIRVVVGSNISNSPGTVTLSSNNSRLSQNTMQIEQVRTHEQYFRTTTLDLRAINVGENLNLGMRFSTSGVINLARLDYVEVEYERSLSLPADHLYFYFNEDADVAATLKNITAETQIWDVTVAHKPVPVNFNRNGSTATFRVMAGRREFVAFNPSKVFTSTEQAGSVDNQDIHALESPDLLIITPGEYWAAANKVADFHREHEGLTVHVLTPETIYNEFSSGTADVSAFRKLMKMWYDRDMATAGEQKIKYCLIMSRPTYDNKMVTAKVKNAGYPRVPIWQSPTGFTENSSYSTDFFIGMLEDNPVSFNIGQAKINVAVGRFPVRSAEEAMTAADKLVNYFTAQDKSSWRNNVMLIADDQDNAQHLTQTETLYEGLKNSNKGADYLYERLYLDTFEQQLTSVGLEYPEAKKRMLAKFEEGQALITYVGHANTVSWTHEHLLNWKDITSFTNKRLPVLYAATCEFGRWDTDDYSGAEVMWAYPKTGVISMITPSRSVFISMNGVLSKYYGLHALTRRDDGTPSTLGDSFVKALNSITGTDDNKLRYCIIGDPAMRMPVFVNDVNVNMIYGTDVTLPDAELPVIEARATPVVKGNVTDAEGNLLADFNGHVYVRLYDAEKVIETLGNGSEGKVILYNDRKTKLYDGVTEVKNGEWEIKINMPSEIENNYTTGRMTFYALADDGREANGSTEKFYVYGYDENAKEDNEGPDILKFTLNHDGFKDGDVTYKTPVVYAEFSDESGINLSDAGIGHALMLTLDGKTVYTDLMNYYMPDLNDSNKGSFTYQLPEITPGKHYLTLSVWDCANNSSYATLNFNVAAVKEPEVYDIQAIFSEDRSGVEFVIASDRPMAALDCNLEVFDVNGIRVWHNASSDRTGADSALRMKWDFTSAAGNRVAKGLYICRATVESPEGKSAKKSKKIYITQ